MTVPRTIPIMMPWSIAFLSILVANLGTAVATVHILHDGTFQERIRDGTWLVVFSSSWCATCKALSPIIEQIASDQRLIDSGVKIGKVDVQTDPSTARDEHVDYIPSIYFYSRTRNVRVPFKDSMSNLFEANPGSQQNPLGAKIVAFVLDQHDRHGSGRSTPTESRKPSASSDVLAEARQFAYQVASQNLPVFTAIVYALGLAQGLFVGVLYRIRTS